MVLVLLLLLLLVRLVFCELLLRLGWPLWRLNRRRRRLLLALGRLARGPLGLPEGERLVHLVLLVALLGGGGALGHRRRHTHGQVARGGVMLLV